MVGLSEEGIPLKYEHAYYQRVRLHAQWRQEIAWERAQKFRAIMGRLAFYMHGELKDEVKSNLALLANM